MQRTKKEEQKAHQTEAEKDEEKNRSRMKIKRTENAKNCMKKTESRAGT